MAEEPDTQLRRAKLATRAVFFFCGVSVLSLCVWMSLNAPDNPVLFKSFAVIYFVALVGVVFSSAWWLFKFGNGPRARWWPMTLVLVGSILWLVVSGFLFLIAVIASGLLGFI